jgi:hypothetical protein
MFAGRRYALIGMAGTIGWYACVVIFWAVQSLSDVVPVGTDYTPKTPTAVSVSVDCNGLFDSAPRGDSPLPALKAQPEGKPKLAFQREPCGVVHDHARTVFILDTAFFGAVVGSFVWLTFRRRRITAAIPASADFATR